MQFRKVLWLAATANAVTIPSGAHIKARQLSSDFPSGAIACSTFPSSYGAVSVSWTNLGGWTGVQLVPGYTPSSSSISTVENLSSGSCVANSFCSYACPAGYEKSQYPDAQPTDGQSVGGLYCNSNGILELSQPNVAQLCTAGVGGLTIQNSLSSNVAVCRLDLPGNEDMTIPLDTQAGTSYPLTVPPASYFLEDGSPTVATYYVNPEGVSVDDACQFGNAATGFGDGAPVLIAASQAEDGTTFVALTSNQDNPNGILSFNIQITGAISSSCRYSAGVFFLNGAETSGGCTVSLSGAATIIFS